MAVVNVDKLTYAAKPRSLDTISNDPNYAFERADVCERGANDAIFSKYSSTAVVYLAAATSIARSPARRLSSTRTSLEPINCSRPHATTTAD
jgi:dTDP-glucose 4,6-dehydratase